MDVKRSSDTDTDSGTDALGKRPAEAALDSDDVSKKSRQDDQIQSDEPPKSGLETFAVPVETPDSLPQEMVLTTETPGEPLPVDQPVAPPPKPRKGKRVRKTNLEKMEILAFVDQGGSQGAAAEKFGVSRTAVTKMVKERTAIAAQALVESSTGSRKVLQYQHKLSVIEDMLYKWQVQVELDAPELKITGDLLQSKAMEFRNKILADYSSALSDEIVLSLTDFKASNGWLHRYMQRRSIRAFSKHEAATASSLATDNAERIQRMRELLLTVTPNCLWNLDQLSIHYRTTSTRLDSVVNMDARSLERVSVGMAVSAKGEKLRLQVVGKDPSPASLKNVDTLATYGIQYRDHYRASHDSHAIIDFLQAMNLEAKARKEVWYVILSSSTAHVAAAHALNPSGSSQNGFRFDAMVLLFLPTGLSNDVQPLDHVFRSFKLHFRCEMLQALLQEHESWAASKSPQQIQQNGGESAPANEASVFDAYAHTQLQNTMSWLQRTWDAIPASLISVAWSTCLYVGPADPSDVAAVSELTSSEHKMYSELLARLAKAPQLQKTLGLGSIETPDQLMLELLSLDKPEPSDELAKDDEIVLDSLSAQGLIRDAHKALVLENIAKEDASPMLSMGEANTAVARLLRFMSQNNDTVLTVAERRTGRANLLILQRLLLKARDRERERESATDFTV